MNCLMIETKDHRRFFTYEKNWPQLIEFSKTFDAEISIVKINEGKVLDLAELAPALCNPDYLQPSITFELVETKVTQERSNRNKILKTADNIRVYILESFLAGEEVSLNDLRTKFSKYKLTTACFCNHVKKTLEALENQGFTAIKTGGGRYRILK